MGHITRYGNYYTDQEWRETQEEFARVAAEEKKITDQISGMENYLARQLNELGLDQNQVRQVVRLFKYGEFGEANVKFSSPERQKKIASLWTSWNTAMNKLEI